MTNGIDWEKRTGKAMENITIDDKLTVMISVLDDVNEMMKPFAETCKVVAKHEMYWKVALFFVSAFSLALVGLFVKVIFHI